MSFVFAMRYGRTSVVNFISRLIMSIAGFVGTVALTRVLGPEQYGAYVVIISVLSWVAIVGKSGLPQAVNKRVSEETDGNYVLAGFAAQVGLYLLVAVVLVLARPILNAFFEVEATLVLVALLGARLLEDLVAMVLRGQQLVHISSLLEPLEWTSRSVVQIALVLSGAGIVGALDGYFVGAAVAAIIGGYFITVRWTRPSAEEFRRLREYAQFSWLSTVNKRAFLSMDTIVLAFFVANGLIAVYEVAWNVASLFAIFASSVRRTLFPEMSRLSSTDGSKSEVEGLLQTSLSYAGLFTVPGLVGSAAIGDIVLRIYGPTFDTGYQILLLLTMARLLYSYQVQLRSTLDAIDRPDLTFRVNAVFVAANVVLNVLLVWSFGWYGAAAATILSTVVGLILSYYYATNVLEVTIPVTEIKKQWIAAGVMGLLVVAARMITGDGLLMGAVLAFAGALVYFGLLLRLSEEFRSTVFANLPTPPSLTDR